MTDAGEKVAERIAESGRGFNVRATVTELVRAAEVSRIGVATGPGSFTGLRSGVSFALGLAMARRIPLRGMQTLRIARARARVAATGLAEAGRGRVYYLTPDDKRGIAAADSVPPAWPATGWLRMQTRMSMESAGVKLLEESELNDFATAAWSVFEGSPELAYGRVRLEYMQEMEWGS